MSCGRKLVRVCQNNCITEQQLADAYNQGYCDGVEAAREEEYCRGYSRGVVDGCQEAKRKAINCIKCIDC